MFPLNTIQVDMVCKLDIDAVSRRLTQEQISALMGGIARVLAAGQRPTLARRANDSTIQLICWWPSDVFADGGILYWKFDPDSNWWMPRLPISTGASDSASS